jgi:hypothetical protein
VRRSNWLRFAKTTCNTNYKAAEDLKPREKLPQAPATSPDYTIMEKAQYVVCASLFYALKRRRPVVGAVEFP